MSLVPRRTFSTVTRSLLPCTPPRVLLGRHDGEEAVAHDPQVAEEVAVREPADHGRHHGRPRELVGQHVHDGAVEVRVGRGDGGREPHDALDLDRGIVDHGLELAHERLGVLIGKQTTVQLGRGLRRHHVDLVGALEDGDRARVAGQRVERGQLTVQPGHELRVPDRLAHGREGGAPGRLGVGRDPLEIGVDGWDDARCERMQTDLLQGSDQRRHRV